MNDAGTGMVIYSPTDSILIFVSNHFHSHAFSSGLETKLMLRHNSSSLIL